MYAVRRRPQTADTPFPSGPPPPAWNCRDLVSPGCEAKTHAVRSQDRLDARADAVRAGARFCRPRCISISSRLRVEGSLVQGRSRASHRFKPAISSGSQEHRHVRLCPKAADARDLPGPEQVLLGRWPRDRCRGEIGRGLGAYAKGLTSRRQRFPRRDSNPC